MQIALGEYRYLGNTPTSKNDAQFDPRQSKKILLKKCFEQCYVPMRCSFYRKLFNKRLFRIKDCLEQKTENSDFYLIKTDKKSNTRLFQKIKNYLNT